MIIMIKVQELTKIFRKPIRGKGLIGMISTLFSRKYTEIRAVDGVSFEFLKERLVVHRSHSLRLLHLYGHYARDDTNQQDLN